jgi:hypothetical protein
MDAYRHHPRRDIVAAAEESAPALVWRSSAPAAATQARWHAVALHSRLPRPGGGSILTASSMPRPRPRPHHRRFGLALGLGAALVVSFGTALVGCKPDHLCEQCGLTCSARGIAEGNATISGIASLDAFFSAVLDLGAASRRSDTAVRGELDGIAVSVGLTPGAAAEEIRAAVEQRIDAAVDGGLRVTYAPPRCETSIQIAAAAAAECDGDGDGEPGIVAVRCEGACNIDASAQAACSASGTLTCAGQAPGLQCAGTCTGTCDMTAAACDGICRGECLGGRCSVVDALGNCAGACDGECTGECSLSAGGECSGACLGECAYTPSGATCDASVQARCEAMVGADVECRGGCVGEAVLPMIAPECAVAVDAKAKTNTECTPPALEITWQWSAAVEGDAAAESAFRAWVEGLRPRLARLVAASAKAELLADLALTLAASAEGAVTDHSYEIMARPAPTCDIRDAMGAACALAQLGDAITLVDEAGGRLAGSVNAAGEVLAAVGG